MALPPTENTGSDTAGANNVPEPGTSSLPLTLECKPGETQEAAVANKDNVKLDECKRLAAKLDAHHRVIRELIDKVHDQLRRAARAIDFHEQVLRGEIIFYDVDAYESALHYWLGVDHLGSLRYTDMIKLQLDEFARVRAMGVDEEI